jgi:GNAT superfamily N-acetyltransferase
MDATPPPARLVEHLRSWAGAWPSERDGVTVVANPRNALPGWDGEAHPVTGVVDAQGRGVLGIPPATYDLLGSTESDIDTVTGELPQLLGRPELEVYRAIFRWSTSPADLPDVGDWVDITHPALPDWLKPFGGAALVVLDAEGAYLAGVGLKRHDEAGWEIAVGTEPAARGQGLARRLVAQAAREVLERGAVPTYFHDPDNVASAAVADAAGFPDRGWTAFGTWHP